MAHQGRVTELPRITARASRGTRRCRHALDGAPCARPRPYRDAALHRRAPRGRRTHGDGPPLEVAAGHRGRPPGVRFSIAPMSARLQGMRERTGWSWRARRAGMVLRVAMTSLFAAAILFGAAVPASAAQGRDDDNGRGREESDDRGRGNDDHGRGNDDRGRAPDPPQTAPPPVSVAPRPVPVPVPPPVPPVVPPVVPAAPVAPPVTTAARSQRQLGHAQYARAGGEPDGRRRQLAGRAPVERANRAPECARGRGNRGSAALAACACEQRSDVDDRRVRRPAGLTDRSRRRGSPVRTVPARLVVAGQRAVAVGSRAPRSRRGSAHHLLLRPARARPRGVLGVGSAPRAACPPPLGRLTVSPADYQMRVGPTSKAIDVASSGIASSGTCTSATVGASISTATLRMRSRSKP